jgi:hypothetical protein
MISRTFITQFFQKFFTNNRHYINGREKTHKNKEKKVKKLGCQKIAKDECSLAQ